MTQSNCKKNKLASNTTKKNVCPRKNGPPDQMHNCCGL